MSIKRYKPDYYQVELGAIEPLLLEHPEGEAVLFVDHAKEIESLTSDREKLAQWMQAYGFSTGHGDTTDDLLLELGWQIKEIRASHSGDAFMEAVRELVDACLDTIATGVPVGHLDSATDKMRALLPAPEVPRE